MKSTLMPSDTLSSRSIKDCVLIETPDGIGLGRVIADGKYYGLPAHLVAELAKTYKVAVNG